jgi:hypothetical protein
MWEKTKRMVKITKIRAAYFAAFINRKDENTVNSSGFVPEEK